MDGGGVDQSADVASNLAPLHRDLERPAQDPETLQHRRRGQASVEEPVAPRLDMFGLKPVQPVPPENRADPVTDIPVVGRQRRRADPPRRDMTDPVRQPLLDRQRLVTDDDLYAVFLLTVKGAQLLGDLGASTA